MNEHTIVVRFPEDVSPSYHCGMEALGGQIVAVDFGGNRLQVAEELQSALEACLAFLEREAAWMDDAEPERQAARKALEKANEVTR